MDMNCVDRGRRNKVELANARFGSASKAVGVGGKGRGTETWSPYFQFAELTTQDRPLLERTDSMTTNRLADKKFRLAEMKYKISFTMSKGTTNCHG
jgi:hypothetical protein